MRVEALEVELMSGVAIKFALNGHDGVRLMVRVMDSAEGGDMEVVNIWVKKME